MSDIRRRTVRRPGIRRLSIRRLGIVLAGALTSLAIAVPTTAQAAPGDTVPITFAMSADGSTRFYPVVEIEVGDPATTMTVILDTGSQELVLWTPFSGGTDTGIPAEVGYVGVAVEGTVYSADVSIGGNPISDVELISGSCVPAHASCMNTATPVDGILGVGQELIPITDDHGTVLTELYSALMQFDDPDLLRGFMITLGTSGGELTLGEYRPDTQVAELKAASLGTTYPNAISAPVFEKPFDVCWQVGQVAPHCQATTIDSGAPGGILTGAAYEQYLFDGDDVLEPFVNISLSDGSSAVPFTTWPTDFERRFMSFEQTIADGHLNTGNAIFLNRSMGYEAATGALHIGAVSGTPSAVRNLRVALDGAATTATWDAPADDGDAVVSTYLVTMRAAGTGDVLSINTVVADSGTIPFTAAPTDTAYTIEVAAMNEYGAGPSLVSDRIGPHVVPTPTPSARPALAESGSTITPSILTAGGAFAALGALLVVVAVGARRRRA